MPKNNYISGNSIYYRHEKTENLSPDTYSLHTHNVYELLYIVSGDITHIIEDRKYKLEKGDLILIRPLHYHFIQIDSTTTYERYNILFDIEKNHLETAESLPKTIEVISLADDPIIENLFSKLDLYHKNCNQNTFQTLIFHLLSELFIYLKIFTQSQKVQSSDISELLSKAISYINDNLHLPLSVSNIAEHLFVSESYLFRMFQKELHQTPKKYIGDKKMFIAQKMLNEGEKPLVVCEKCGFGDYTTFYRNYVAFFGFPPSKNKRS